MERDEIARDRVRTAAVETAAVELEVNPAAGDEGLLNWGSIWAGLLTAFAVFVLLSLTALAAGLQAAPVGDPGEPRLGPQIAGILTGLFMVIAFFAGGFVAAWSARLAEPEPAILHGFLVWALWMLLLLVFVALGVGQALGIAAQVFGSEFVPGTDTNVSPAELVELFRDAAWQTLFAMILAVVSSILGALLATRDEVRARMPLYRWRRST